VSPTRLDTFKGYLEAGGFVMPPLVLGAMLLWYTIGYRFLTLQRGSSRHVRTLVRRYQSGGGRRPRGLIDRAARCAVQVARSYPGHVKEVVDDAFFPYYQDAKKGRAIIISVVSIAPLLGLLGTVAGMIETFDSLGDMSLFSQSGGIAGGISQALFSTQMGLCVAIPGVIVGRLLDRRQRRLEDELDQIKALVAAPEMAAVPGGAA
jgi:biopolymer transport protein ExbB